MALKMVVKYVDGRVEPALIGPKVQVQTERQFKVSMASDVRLEYVYFMAWKALNLAGKEPNDFDHFLDLVDEVEEQPEDEQADAESDPTATAPGPAES